MSTDWDNFDRDYYFSNPEPEPLFAQNDSDPIIGLPPDFEKDYVQSVGISSDGRAWPYTQPSNEIWDEIWDDIKDIIPEITGAVLDTGVNPHSVLPKPVFEESMINGQSPRDGNSHGTHCMSSFLGSNGIGVAPGCKAMNIKVLSNQGSGSSSGIARGIRLAVDKGANVISLSLGGPSLYQPTIDAIKYAFSKGVLVFAAAGNSGTRGMGFPGGHPSVPGVANYMQNGQIANSSSRGKVFCAGPGTNIKGASNRDPNGFFWYTGTSMACPHVAALGAVWLAYRYAAGLTRINAVEDLFSSWKRYLNDAGRPGYDNEFGDGVVDTRRFAKDFAHFGKQYFIKMGE